MEYTEELLEQLETELRKLHEFYKANEYVFGKVEECNKLWKQFLAIEQTTHDPERLKSANVCKCKSIEH